jgi:hypothetical protein
LSGGTIDRRKVVSITRIVPVEILVTHAEVVEHLVFAFASRYRRKTRDHSPVSIGLAGVELAFAAAESLASHLETRHTHIGPHDFSA